MISIQCWSGLLKSYDLKYLRFPFICDAFLGIYFKEMGMPKKDFALERCRH